ncbi:ATP-binding cassette domain-containing protein [Paraconexibacter antarcticus]|uniref:ATP-binding cassette domain-containing protein n=1 Tax=Paraconexibacter antarcticus TaxID=2949664 RepID=A0ABY5DX70_9ACTN|nr:ATP-binding cassette domain-containing protein [Paraconexibacter antarcticus]UTI65437.1 ATP-binding cassette domain-containing protein [Paraconexibacter antarcticus]
MSVSGLPIPDQSDRLGSPPTATLLVAEGVSVRAGEQTLVQPTSLTLAAGELVAVIGPSGAGKTSLLRALAGTLPLAAGRVQTAGGAAGAVGFVPADDLLHDELTVFEELLFAARLRAPAGGDGGDVLARVHEVIDDLRLTGLEEARVATLSKGQRRRTSCGVELVGRPGVLLLDEPAAGLDPGLERRLMIMLRRLADEGRGVLVATHSTASLHRCDTVVAVSPGGIVRYAGPPDGMVAALGVEDLEEVYDALTDDTRPAGRPAGGTPGAAARPVLTPAGGGGGSGRMAPAPGQLPALLAREAICHLRDRRSLAILLGQAPVIGIAMAVVLPRGVLGDQTFGPFYGVLFAFMLLTASIWLGVIAACRQVVSQRAIIERELAVGVRPGGYLVAKALALMPVVALQTLLLAGAAMALQPVPQGAPLIVGFCIVTGWSAAAMGLWLSAAARTPDQATTSVPLLLIPQLLFAGALIPIDKMIPPLKVLTDAVLGRWALAAIGGAMGLDERLGSNLGAVTGLQSGFFGEKPLVALAAMAAIGAAFLALGVRALGRENRP